MICVVDSHAGIYAPQEFVERYEKYLSGVDPADVEEVKAGPDAQYYWDAWDMIVNNAIIIDDDGKRWRIFEDQDIFLIPDEEE